MRAMLLVDVEGVSLVNDVRSASWDYPGPGNGSLAFQAQPQAAGRVLEAIPLDHSEFA